jgi:hypothetical protein
LSPNTKTIHARGHRKVNENSSSATKHYNKKVYFGKSNEKLFSKGNRTAVIPGSKLKNHQRIIHRYT